MYLFLASAFLSSDAAMTEFLQECVSNFYFGTELVKYQENRLTTSQKSCK